MTLFFKCITFVFIVYTRNTNVCNVCPDMCRQSRNEWHHVAVVWTGRDVNMYMDGERKDSSPLTGE